MAGLEAWLASPEAWLAGVESRLARPWGKRRGRGVDVCSDLHTDRCKLLLVPQVQPARWKEKEEDVEDPRKVIRKDQG